jgi:FPC/CPF motif-containing protein YcgG
MLLTKHIPARGSEKLERRLLQKFREFILEQDHPCVMAKSVFLNEEVQLRNYRTLGSIETAEKLMCDLKNFVKNYSFDNRRFSTFIATFTEQEIADENHFEELLWRQLRLIKQCDSYPWDPSVDSNPESENFSFSIAGKAFYIVGMHPKGSRKARQTPYPCIAFNLHWQFEKLRDMGIYEEVRDRIRTRDKERNGSINPMLEDFGSNSEARQYSGRAVGQDWKCPFGH